MSQSTPFYAFNSGGKEGGGMVFGQPPQFLAEETNKMSQKELRTVERIYAMLTVHESLGQYVSKIQVSVENAIIVMRGSLPNQDLLSALVPAVRQAGVLGQVNNCVDVPA